MTHVLNQPVSIHELSWYILTRGLCLAGMLLFSALVLLLHPAAGASELWLTAWYAGYLQTMAAMLTGAVLIGSLLLEDVLRRVH